MFHEGILNIEEHLVTPVYYPFNNSLWVPLGNTILPPSVASVSMCTYGVLPACVNVTWLYLCQKSSTERRGRWLVISTKHLCKDND